MTKDEFRAWRRSRNWTQAKMAETLERGKRQIEKYEAGEAEIPLVIVLALEALEYRERPTTYLDRLEWDETKRLMDAV